MPKQLVKVSNMPIPIDLKAIIFDMDGVIVDSEPIHVESFRIFLDRLNVSYKDEFIDNLVGYSIDHNIQTINDHFLSDNPLPISEGVKGRDEIYLELINQRELQPLEGLPELIKLCQKKGIRIALASSSTREQVDILLANLSRNKKIGINFTDVFRLSVSGDEVQAKKPAPDLYRAALSLLGEKAENCLAIEDSEVGILSAKSNNLFCIALKNEYFSLDRLDKADLIVDSLYDIVHALER